MGHGLITVDSRMRKNPARWHLEDLNPIYKTVEEAELQEALEELEIKGD